MQGELKESLHYPSLSLSLCLFLLSPFPRLKYLLAVTAFFPFSSWLKSQPWLMAQCAVGRLPPWHYPLEEWRALRWHRAVKTVSWIKSHCGGGIDWLYGPLCTLGCLNFCGLSSKLWNVLECDCARFFFILNLHICLYTDVLRTSTCDLTAPQMWGRGGGVLDRGSDRTTEG